MELRHYSTSILHLFKSFYSNFAVSYIPLPALISLDVVTIRKVRLQDMRNVLFISSVSMVISLTFPSFVKGQDCESSFVSSKSLNTGTFESVDKKTYFDPNQFPGYLDGNRKSYSDFSYGPNGKRPPMSTLFVSNDAFVAIYDGQLRMVDAQTGTFTKTFNNAGQFRNQLPFQFGPFLLKDKQSVAFVDSNTVRLFSLKRDEYFGEFSIASRNPDEPTANVLISTDGSLLFWIGALGGKQIFSLTTGKPLFDSPAPEWTSSGSQRPYVKGHRPHIIQSPDGRYVFFISHDYGTKETASSLLFDLAKWEVVSPPGNFLDSVREMFSDRSSGGRMFSGVTSALFADGKVTLLQGKDGFDTSEGIFLESLEYRELNLADKTWRPSSISTGFGSQAHGVRTRQGYTDRIWRSFASTLGYDVRFVDVGARQNSQGEHHLIDGYLSSLVVTSSATGQRIRLKLDHLSAMHEVREVFMVDDSSVLFQAQYAVGKSFNQVAGKILYDHFRRPAVERALAQNYVDGQRSWFRLDLRTFEVTRIDIPGYDSLAVSNPEKASDLRLTGVSPDGTNFVFSQGSNGPILTFSRK